MKLKLSFSVLIFLAILMPFFVFADKANYFVEKITLSIIEDKNGLQATGWNVHIYYPDSKKEEIVHIDSTALYSGSREIILGKDEYPGYDLIIWDEAYSDIFKKENALRQADESEVQIKVVHWDEEGNLLIDNKGMGVVISNNKKELLVVAPADLVRGGTAIQVDLSGFRNKSHGMIDTIIVKDFVVDEKNNAALFKVPASGHQGTEMNKQLEVPFASTKPYIYGSINNQLGIIFSEKPNVQKIYFNRSKNTFYIKNPQELDLGQPLFYYDGSLLGLYVGNGEIIPIQNIQRSVKEYLKNSPVFSEGKIPQHDNNNFPGVAKKFYDKGFEVLEKTELETGYYYRDFVGWKVTVRNRSGGESRIVDIFWGPSYITKKSINEQIDSQLGLRPHSLLPAKKEISQKPKINIFGEEARVKGAVEAYVPNAMEVFIDKRIYNELGRVIGWEVSVMVFDGKNEKDTERSFIIYGEKLVNKSYKDQIAEWQKTGKNTSIPTYQVPATLLQKVKSFLGR